MIQEFVRRWEARKGEVRDAFAREGAVQDYDDVVRAVITALRGETDRDKAPDPERITCIEPDDYAGTLVYVIAAKQYQPSDFWYCRIDYGSCSGCDTLERILMDGGSRRSLNARQIDDLMTLALHVVQRLKPMDDEAEVES